MEHPKLETTNTTKSNYKDAFFVVAFLLLLTIGVGTTAIISLNKKLDAIDRYIVNNQITEYIEAGWLPPVDMTIRHKKRVPKKPKENK